MNNSVNTIKSLIHYLPKKDILYADKFIKIRDFTSLKELVDSAIKRIKKNLNSENPKEEYLDIDIDGLNTLKSEVDAYMSYQEFPEDLGNYDYDDRFLEDEYY